MFIVHTYIGASPIHGTGVFAGEDVAVGQPIWRFAPGLDLIVPFDQIEKSPKAFRDDMEMYAYVSPQVNGGMILSCDHANFLNHSDDPNTEIQGETTLARRPIKTGEEITCDYGICCANWPGHF